MSIDVLVEREQAADIRTSAACNDGTTTMVELFFSE